MAPMAALSALTTVAVAAPPRDPRPSFGSFFFFHQYDSHLRAIKSNRSFNHLALRRKCSHGGRSASARVRSAVDDTSQSVEEQPAAVSPYDTVTMFFHVKHSLTFTIHTTTAAISLSFSFCCMRDFTFPCSST
ncbi:hypothetical protein SAY87_002896 [Trapa incisa]|uniref:Uncharacterized protein n=1 Tax=Trapa incisa TaxID=236973 RepID=A0AAN7KQH4_9MYRT|nr:hypothetical protein SAY87_002896 [Trapa incisa]